MKLIIGNGLTKLRNKKNKILIFLIGFYRITRTKHELDEIKQETGLHEKRKRK